MGSLLVRSEASGLPLFFQDDKHCDTTTTSSQCERRRTGPTWWHGVPLLALAFLLSTSYFQYRRWNEWSGPSPAASDPTTYVGLSRETQQAWASYSPYFSAAEYTAPPGHCEIVQVNLLQRHGARFPSPKVSRRIKKALQKLVDAGSYAGTEYQFLGEFEWDLGTNDLIPHGEREAFDSGIEHYMRYKHLIKDDQLPFVRASRSQRVEYSAMNWTQGFSAASGHEYSPIISVILSEEKGANNTLHGSMCPNAKANKEPGNTWRDKFTPPITKRINEAAPGAELDNDEVAELMPLCAFETLFHEATSPFCGLFTAEEWQASEYYDDVVRYYSDGYGNPLGPVQGVGYVNELLARLTGQPVSDETQTNRTLDASPVTFPLDRNLYADFSHHSEMLTIYSAMGLFRPDEPPVTDRIDQTRTWRVSEMTPFSGRMIAEKLWCASSSTDAEEYVRILVNDAVQPLEFCGADGDGLCTLGAFVESQAYARSNGNGDWERCFA